MKSYFTEFLDLLRPEGGESPAEIKKNYLRLVRENHPDVFPEEERPEQNIILMELNEAYMRCLENEVGESEPKSARPGRDDRTPHPAGTEIQQHAAPDYAYYKTGFRRYQQGQHVFNNSRFSLKNVRNTFDLDPASVLRTALHAQECYLDAYRNFYKVARDHPRSIWNEDAREKMNEIEKLQERYRLIIENLNFASGKEAEDSRA